MQNRIPCWHCGAEYAADQEKIPLFGERVHCPSCTRSFYVMKTDAFYRSHFPEEIFFYILHRHCNQHVEGLEKEVQVISRFVQHLTTLGKTLRTVNRGEVEHYGRDHIDPAIAPAFEQILTELFETMRLHGIRDSNPIAETKTTVALARMRTVVAQGIDAYRRYREESGRSETLEEDIQWIQTLEKFLAARGRSSASATADDISQFLMRYVPEMPDTDRLLNMLIEYCGILQKEGLLSDNPFTLLSTLLLQAVPTAKRPLLPSGAAMRAVAQSRAGAPARSTPLDRP
ncbi:MAG: hypothetical protein HQL88_03145, partial [Magnetococcales bacterium]|nr:hypothetical protein [Magnetococcales bacterium]